MSTRLPSLERWGDRLERTDLVRRLASAFDKRQQPGQRPAVGVILVRARIDSSVLAGALRAGMREVVEARDLTGLAGQRTRLARTLPQRVGSRL